MTLGQGCNSAFRGRGWQADAIQKLDRQEIVMPGLSFEIIPRKIKSLNGIGGAKVKTNDMRRLTCTLKFQSKNILPCSIHSHDEDGGRPLLLSEGAQSKRGFVKDMGK